MAQADLFSNYSVKNVGSELDKAEKQGVITLNEKNDLLQEIYTREFNIAVIKKNALKTDGKSLNIFKNIAQIGKQVYSLQKSTYDLNKQIKKNEKFLSELDKKIAKAKTQNNTKLVAALQQQYERKRLSTELDKVSLDQMRRTIPVLGSMGKFGLIFSNVFVGVVTVGPGLGGKVN